MNTKLIIGGDFFISKEHLASNLFDNKIINIFKNSDFNIVNLECPITINDSENKIYKTGSYLRTNTKIFEYLNKLNINAVTLANNHILDYGQTGLKNTIDVLNKEKIQFVGAGLNLFEASQPLIIEKKGIKIGVVNFCENEWSVASSKSGGANPFDIIDNLSQIRKAKELADFVIVVVHGGHEDNYLPAPRMVKQYRFFAENGADAVIGHHPRCISGFEIYNNVPIVYSLGVFVDTRVKTENNYKSVLLAQLSVQKGFPIQIEFIPLKTNKDSFVPELMNSLEKEALFQQLEQYNKIIANQDLLMNEWNNYLGNKKETLNVFSPINVIPGRYIRAAMKRLGLNKYLLKKQNLIQILNHIRCEAHKDVVVALLIKRKRKDENSYSPCN